jgi:acyl-CoA dehydrogenase
MSEATALLIETASRIFSDHCTRAVTEAAERGAWPDKLWQALDETGLASAAKSEARGGAGIEAADVFALARLLGRRAVPVPLVETLLAEELLAAAGLPPRAGALTIGPVLRRDQLVLKKQSAGWTVSGTLHRVPWARHANAIVVVAQDGAHERTAIVDVGYTIEDQWNYAREPRETVRLDEHKLPEDAVAAPGAGYTREALYFRGALYRALEMAGALETLLELTVRYAQERIQFGRPIGKYQAVQQQIAALASHAAAAAAAAQAASDTSGAGIAQFEIAAAKARVGEAVAVAAGIAHQVHASIGFSHEHELHRSTRRLWSWRDEFGTETEWAAWVGQAVAGIGGEGLWKLLTSRTRHDARVRAAP